MTQQSIIYTFDAKAGIDYFTNVVKFPNIEYIY
jgi:hypothetical protein